MNRRTSGNCCLNFEENVYQQRRNVERINMEVFLYMKNLRYPVHSNEKLIFLIQSMNLHISIILFHFISIHICKHSFVNDLRSVK